MKGESWLGLWECEEVQLPYHPSIRHLAFKMEIEDLENAKKWLEELEIPVRTSFGFTKEQQPLVLPNNPHAHGAIYFSDPDGNSIELICPLRLYVNEEFKMMTPTEWNAR